MSRLIFLNIFTMVAMAHGQNPESTAYQSHGWKSLLHITERGPTVVSPEFYLSAKPELAEELGAHLQKFRATDGQSLACQFPERYRWLARRFSLPIFDLTTCRELNDFVRSFAVGTIELALASEKSNSSASAFGHIMLIFRPTSAPLDTADVVHFAALSDPNDPLYAYVYRGLRGKYEGAFIRDPFFKKYDEYVVAEQRYLFFYELAVTADQRLSLLYHLWELRQARFRYFFKDENCAYQVGALLSVIEEGPSAFANNFMVLPIDIVRAQDSKIQKMEHLAPLSRSIERQWSAMNRGEQKQFNALIGDARGPGPVPDLVKSAAADYALYKFRTNRKAQVPNFVSLRDLKFKAPVLTAETEEDPRHQARSRTLYLGLGYQAKTAYQSLRFKPVQHGLIEPKESRTRESEMLLLDTTLRFSRDAQVSLENFTLLSTQLLAKRRAPFFPLSWGVFLGLRRQNPQRRLQAESEISFGLSQELWRHFTVSALLRGGFAWGAGSGYLYAAPQVIASYYLLPAWKLSVSALSKQSRAEVLHSLEVASVLLWKAHTLQFGAASEPQATNRNLYLAYGYSF